MTRRRIVLAVLLAALAGLLYYFYGGSSTPAGQPRLTRLTPVNFSDFRNSFNASSDSVRVVAMLSPT